MEESEEDEAAVAGKGEGKGKRKRDEDEAEEKEDDLPELPALKKLRVADLKEILTVRPAPPVCSPPHFCPRGLAPPPQ